jgi:endonuclease YncB( thermonuclease family)
LSGKVVKIYYDTLAKNKDKYGRLLRYVFIPYKYKDKKYWLPYGAFAIYKGWAKVYKYEDFVLKRIYYKLEDIAKKKRRGIWSSKCQLEDKLIKERYLLNLSPRQKQDKDGRIDNRNIDFNSCGYTYHKK